MTWKEKSMLCVSCGFCCKTMSPINHGYCPLLIKEDSPSGTVYYCSDYENRPQECRNHVFDRPICPIGQTTLNLITEEEILARLHDVQSVMAIVPF